MPAQNSQQGMPDMSNLLESLIGEMPGMKDLPPEEKKKMKKAIKATKFVGGYTLTATAMQKALTHYSAKMRSDTLTAKVRGG